MNCLKKDVSSRAVRSGVSPSGVFQEEIYGDVWIGSRLELLHLRRRIQTLTQKRKRLHVPREGGGIGKQQILVIQAWRPPRVHLTRDHRTAAGFASAMISSLEARKEDEQAWKSEVCLPSSLPLFLLFSVFLSLEGKKDIPPPKLKCSYRRGLFLFVFSLGGGRDYIQPH